MPSIPQSLLWISLVVLWLFVLVPMLISKRDAVRRTSDVALATRVLNSGRSARLRRSRVAAGHHSDPDWRPSADDLDDEFDHDEFDQDEDEAPKRSVVLAAAPAEDAEPDYLDVDIVEEEPAALSLGAPADDADDTDTDDGIEDDAVAETRPEEPVDESVEEQAGQDEIVDAAAESEQPQAIDDGTGDEYEYVPDSSGLEASQEAAPEVESLSAARRRRYESKTAEAVSARKYQFRKRMVTALAVALLASGVAGYLIAPWAWWVCGVVGSMTVLYLAYLRRQTRIEEQLRRRRAQRIKRSRLGVENTNDQDLDVVPARLRRPGAAVLEIDDEDPIFEHLDEVAFARRYDLPKAAGQ